MSELDPIVTGDRLGRIVVSLDLLEGWLALPEGSVIRRVSDANHPYHRTFSIVVESDQLEPVAEGSEIPEVWYTVTERIQEGKFEL